MSTIPLLFLQRFEENPTANCMEVISSSGNWESVTYSEAFYKIGGFAQRLYALGVDTGSNVAIRSRSRAEVYFVETAIWALGGIVTLVSCDEPDAIKSLLEQQKVEMLIVEHCQQYIEMEAELDELDELVHILSIEPSEEILPLTAASVDKDWFVQKINSTQDQSPATFLADVGVINHRICRQIVKQYGSYIRSEDKVLLGGVLRSGNRFFAYASLLSEAKCFVESEEVPKHLKALQPTLALVRSSDLTSYRYFVTKKYGKPAHLLLQWSDLITDQRKRGSRKKRVQFQAALSKRLLSLIFSFEILFEGLLIDQEDHFQTDLWSLLPIKLIPNATNLYWSKD